MSEPTSQVRITLKEGPVRLLSAPRSGVDASYELWDGITASEHFPPNTDNGYYLLSLSKQVLAQENVPEVEARLVSVLKALVTTWPFAGGSFIVLDIREVVSSPRFESNAQEVSTDLLAWRGVNHVSASATVAFESLAGYSRFPLADAALVVRAGRTDVGLRRLLEYHQNAWIAYYGRGRSPRSEWFIDLYKVRDMLRKIYRTEQLARQNLDITPSDWRCFGKALNGHDLRHAEISDVVPYLQRTEVDNLFRLARGWVAAHLRVSGLPAV